MLGCILGSGITLTSETWFLPWWNIIWRGRHLKIKGKRILVMWLQKWFCYWTQVPDAQWGQKTQNVRVWSREVFIAGPSKENGWLVLKNPELPDGFRGEAFIGNNCGEGCRVCGFLLIGWWWGNRAVLQESCAQPEVTILHLTGGLSSCRRAQRNRYVCSLRRNQDPAPWCTMVPWLLLPCFCIPSLP